MESILVEGLSFLRKILFNWIIWIDSVPVSKFYEIVSVLKFYSQKNSTYAKILLAPKFDLYWNSIYIEIISLCIKVTSSLKLYPCIKIASKLYLTSSLKLYLS